ncbi:membrane-associated kinase regulator-like protein, putative [Medicago truncatula]|uniref:Membrane-associated kinase regulator-like protein, putative n=1 Tax=Medicago truncatula TaxID=3880 RepID=A0A072U8P3_MEDTR|nr:membrane-associated kinase regulator-like protein, putative [Medicago truncatula]
METSHPISIESFSNSWLVNPKPNSLVESLDDSFRTSLDAYDEASSFIEMNPKMPPSKRFFINSQDFKFHFPTSHSSLNLVDADQLFSNDSNSTSASSSSSHIPQKVVPLENSGITIMKMCRTLSRRMFQKYFNFFRHLGSKLRGHKSGPRHENVGKRTQSVKNKKGNYRESSPRISVSYSKEDWRVSCDSEISIYNAVLHCKRSIERMS